jgi:hypothetical protein
MGRFQKQTRRRNALCILLVGTPLSDLFLKMFRVCDATPASLNARFKTNLHRTQDAQVLLGQFQRLIA